MRGEVRPKYLQAIFEYFPYYSSRTHSFMDRKKSTIRNKEFKETYCTFLLTGLLDKVDCPAFKIALVYYLLLQDRIL